MAKFSENKGTYAKIVRLKIQRNTFEQERGNGYEEMEITGNFIESYIDMVDESFIIELQSKVRNKILKKYPKREAKEIENDLEDDLENETELIDNNEIEEE